jgi:hypothetical protein
VTTNRRQVGPFLALLAAIVLGLSVAGAVLGALVRVPDRTGTPPASRVDGPAAPLTGGTPSPTPAITVTPVNALAASTPVAAPVTAQPPGPAASTAPAVRITSPVDAVTVPAGAELVVDLAGTALAPWDPPSDSDPAVLRPLSIDAEPLALHAVYLGTRPGTAVLELDRLAVCTSVASAGVCPAQAYRVTVTVTAR